MSNLWCRVNNAGFLSHKVLERIEWGYEDMASGIFEKAVLITTTEGKNIKRLSPRHSCTPNCW